MFSEILYELDKNTAKLMIEEQQQEIEEQRKLIDSMREEQRKKDEEQQKLIEALQDELRQLKENINN